MPTGAAMARASSAMSKVFTSAGISDTLVESYSQAKSRGVR